MADFRFLRTPFFLVHPVYLQLGDTADCTDKRNCIMLSGLYQCKAGSCTSVTWPWQCDRVCPPVSVTPATTVIVVRYSVIGSHYI